MAKDGYYFLTPLVVIALIFWWVGFSEIAFVPLVLGVGVIFFFRDPERNITDDPQAVVSPADGKIIRVEHKEDHVFVSIFLSILDVHVTRAPIEGVITKGEYQAGRFRIAYDERASVENEQLVITIAGEHELTFSLIAGIIARRIRFWKEKGQQVSKGDRIGLIRFGSRVDVMLPLHCQCVVKIGDRVMAGSSVIARWEQVA